MRSACLTPPRRKQCGPVVASVTHAVRLCLYRRLAEAEAERTEVARRLDSASADVSTLNAKIEVLSSSFAAMSAECEGLTAQQAAAVARREQLRADVTTAEADVHRELVALQVLLRCSVSFMGQGKNTQEAFNCKPIRLLEQ